MDTRICKVKIVIGNQRVDIRRLKAPMIYALFLCEINADYAKYRGFQADGDALKQPAAEMVYIKAQE